MLDRATSLEFIGKAGPEHYECYTVEIQSFAINLASATERMYRMQRIFDEAGIQSTRFDAVDSDHAASHPDGKAIPAKRHRDRVS